MLFYGRLKGPARGAKVAWSKVRLSKHDGGLGVKKIKEWNVAFIFRCIWICL